MKTATVVRTISVSQFSKEVFLFVYATPVLEHWYFIERYSEFNTKTYLDFTLSY